MGVVYLAKDPEGRRVAVKHIRAELAVRSSARYKNSSSRSSRCRSVPTWRHEPADDIRAEGLARRAERRSGQTLVSRGRRHEGYDCGVECHVRNARKSERQGRSLA